jgi:hypothetical protein
MATNRPCDVQAAAQQVELEMDLSRPNHTGSMTLPAFKDFCCAQNRAAAAAAAAQEEVEEPAGEE